MEAPTSITSKHTGATLSRREIVARQVIAGAALKRAYGGRYGTPLAYALGVSRSSVRDWICGRQPIPIARERALLALIDETIEWYQQARKIYALDLAERERQPKRRRGMLVVADHGDGLPPHNQQAWTLKRLGLPLKAKATPPSGQKNRAPEAP